MLKLSALLLFTSACATGLVKKVEFSPQVETDRRQILSCAWLPQDGQLVCLTPDEAYLILKEHSEEMIHKGEI